MTEDYLVRGQSGHVLGLRRHVLTYDDDEPWKCLMSGPRMTPAPSCFACFSVKGWMVGAAYIKGSMTRDTKATTAYAADRIFDGDRHAYAGIAVFTGPGEA